MSQRLADRLWLDRVNAHGPEILQALKDLIPVAERAADLSCSAYNEGEWNKILDTLERANALVYKLESKPLKSG